MILALYLVVAIWLSLYGLQSLILIILYIKHRRQNPPQLTVSVWPAVAVQLPVFNERHVVERLIDSAAELDYPHDRLVVQVLDDSTDDTTAIAERRAARWRECGVDVRVLHRVDRDGLRRALWPQVWSRRKPNSWRSSTPIFAPIRTSCAALCHLCYRARNSGPCRHGGLT